MRVHVTSLQREGTLGERQQNGEWTVIVGMLTVRCREVLLRVLPQVVAKKGKVLKTSRQHQRARPLRCSSKGYSTLDLHGLRVEEALERIESFISTAIVEQRRGVEIVHGLGTGRLQQALHSYLTQCNVVARFHLEVTNPGKTWVHFF